MRFPIRIATFAAVGLWCAWAVGGEVADQQHWSLRALKTVGVPRVSAGAAPRNKLDRFVIAALESRGLGLSKMASARTLVRRIYFDLIGLPPTPEEVEKFVADAAADPHAAVKSLVGRLLESRHYGERWGRHWLDVARYADSNGQEGDQDRPVAYTYRDFVIQALNDDLPFDVFVRWQIAGDELAPDDPRAIAATGFLVAGPHTVLDVPMEEEKIRNRFNELDDTLATLGSAMLGLTVGCARCHDHKFDPIPTRDYYRMLCAFQSGDRTEAPLASPAQIEAHKQARSRWDERRKAAKADRGALAEIAAAEPKPLPVGFVFRDSTDKPVQSYLLHRADFYDKSEPVGLGFLTALGTAKSADAYWTEARSKRSVEKSTYQRAALANWITDVEQGAGALAARVIVNRVWRHHFGEGLVRSASDFGTQGEEPSHPELLEWLAHDFVRHGWRLKRLHRQIVTSAAYLQDSAWDEATAKVDPDNRLLWRRRPMRLEAEILRDAMLATAGTMNLTPFGPAFKPPVAAEAMVARNLKTPYDAEPADSANVRRRSVYMFHKRVVPYPLLQTFDRPDALQSCGRRDTTTVAPQALALLNDPFVRDRAVELADRIGREAAGDEDKVIGRAFAICFSRTATDSEQKAAKEFVSAQRAKRAARDGKEAQADAPRKALADFCQVLFGLNEFLYID